MTKSVQNTNHTLTIRVTRFLIGCMFFAFFHQLMTTRAYDLVNYIDTSYMKSFFGRSNMITIAIGSFSSFIELLFIIIAFIALDYQKKYLVNQKALIAAQLNALRMQLHPHFLFNTLHSIASMIDIDKKNAQSMLSKLGTLLRSMLEFDAEQMVFVRDELKFIRDYLDLEQIRYQDRVTINYSISDDTLSEKIPNLIFQPLVENAVKYGAIPTIDNGKIDIDFSIQYCDTLLENTLVLKISNTYNTENTFNYPKGTGFGLVNIEKRLQQFYQNKYVFNHDFVTPELYVAEIKIPISKNL